MQLFRSLIVAGTLVAVAAGSAPAQQPVPPVPAGRHAVKAAMARRAKRRQHVHKQLMRGIALSDAEKASIKSVREKYAPQMQALRTQARTQLQTARSARQRGDTAAFRSIRTNLQAQRTQAKSLRQAEQNDVRAAMTPANRATFDANLARIRNRQSKQTLRGQKLTKR